MEPMSMQKALQVVATYDTNHNGMIDQGFWHNELYFDSEAKHWLDEDNDGKISVKELAKGLVNGDVHIGYSSSWGNTAVSMNHRIGEMPAVAPGVRMDVKVKAQVETR